MCLVGLAGLQAQSCASARALRLHLVGCARKALGLKPWASVNGKQGGRARGAWRKAAKLALVQARAMLCL